LLTGHCVGGSASASSHVMPGGNSVTALGSVRRLACNMCMHRPIGVYGRFMHGDVRAARSERVRLIG